MEESYNSLVCLAVGLLLGVYYFIRLIYLSQVWAVVLLSIFFAIVVHAIYSLEKSMKQLEIQEIHIIEDTNENNISKK